ncbi:hypothetical protein [Aliagarivorans taiwanensis]|uniref:hypothetical protein n=1 Tax=Aliagarivorans taiwanensis TaxID=561966 RepID=UPI000479B8C1|nr:hypothetical protein [Aliagarivorans taiwanensis]
MRVDINYTKADETDFHVAGRIAENCETDLRQTVSQSLLTCTEGGYGLSVEEKYKEEAITRKTEGFEQFPKQSSAKIGAALRRVYCLQ